MEKKNYRQLLTQRNFLRLMLADAVSRFGDSLDVIVYSLIMYEITRSESLMALIMGLNYVPTVLLQPFVGVWVDRMPKKQIMVVTDLLRFLLVVCLSLLYAAGMLTPLILAVLTLCTSAVEAFRLPAGSAFLPQLLDSDCYTLGKAANFSLSRMATLIGLIVAGSLVSLVGAAAVLWIDGITFLLSALIIVTIAHPEAVKHTAVSIQSVFRDFSEGIAFLKTSRALQAVGLIGLLINFGLMPLSVFQTPYVYDHLHMGAEVLSLIKTLMVLGMMTGAALAPKLDSVSSGAKAVLSGVGMGCSIACMYLIPLIADAALKMALLVICMLAVGAGGGILNVLVGSCMMRTVPRQMMGRISGLNAAVMESSMPIGAFICSALAVSMSITQIFLLFGLATAGAYMLLKAIKWTDML